MSDTEETEVLEETEVEEASPEEMAAALGALMNPANEPRVIGIFGDINEENSSAACGAMLAFSKLASEPIEVFLSTNGGSADEMYGIVDTMRYLQSQDCEIHVMGVGKIMSAGVLILASGTKGKRKIGKNTRLMLHPIQGGSTGSFVDMKDDISIMQKMQEKYIKSLVEVSSLTYRELKKIVNKRFDTYFTAEEAVEMGLADEIF